MLSSVDVSLQTGDGRLTRLERIRATEHGVLMARHTYELIREESSRNADAPGSLSLVVKAKKPSTKSPTQNEGAMLAAPSAASDWGAPESPIRPAVPFLERESPCASHDTTFSLQLNSWARRIIRHLPAPKSYRPPPRFRRLAP